MDEREQFIQQAIKMTRVVRSAKQHLATFGDTDVHYFIVTDPTYTDVVPSEEESVVREGRAISRKPKIVTPAYMLNLEGFSDDAKGYMEGMVQKFGPNSPGILYQYTNEPVGMDIVSGKPSDVCQRIADDLDKRGEDKGVVIKGVDALWDVSLMKFVYDYTVESLSSNVTEMQAMGLFDAHPGTDIPNGAMHRIEGLFQQVKDGLDPAILKKELDRWGLFEQYQDRFFALFR